MIYTISKKKTSKFNIKDKPSVQLVKWDQLSQNYFIAVWIDGTLSLFDSESEKEYQKFDKQSAGISSLVWMKSIPGGFITSNEKIAAIKLWTVSNKYIIINEFIKEYIIYIKNPIKNNKSGFMWYFENVMYS